MNDLPSIGGSEHAAPTRSLYVCRAEALRRTLDFVFNFFPISQTFVPTETGYVVAVHEDVLASVAWLNEAKSFLNTEPLYFSARHNLYRFVDSPSQSVLASAGQAVSTK